MRLGTCPAQTVAQIHMDDPLTDREKLVCVARTSLRWALVAQVAMQKAWQTQRVQDEDRPGSRGSHGRGCCRLRASFALQEVFLGPGQAWAPRKEALGTIDALFYRGAHDQEARIPARPEHGGDPSHEVR